MVSGIADHGLARIPVCAAADCSTSPNNHPVRLGRFLMSKSIAVFGVGSGLGQAVARRYARQGYEVVLVARRREPLDVLAKDSVFAPAAELTPQVAQDFMPLGFYTLLALVQEFLPHMLKQRHGAILTAQGTSSLQGLPNLSGPGPAQAAQRNYLQSLRAEVADKGVYVGMLYIGAAVEGSTFHIEMERARAAGEPGWQLPVASSALLAERLWTMHATNDDAEVTYP
jgi:short-subunit dehydrogenase